MRAGLTPTLRQISTDTLNKMAEAEALRRDRQWELDALNTAAAYQGWGNLAGTALGAGVGAYRNYKQNETNQDVQRGAQARKDFESISSPEARTSQVAGRRGDVTLTPTGVETTPSDLPASDRSPIYSRSGTITYPDSMKTPAGLSTLRDKLTDVGREQAAGFQRGLAEAVGLQPRFTVAPGKGGVPLMPGGESIPAPAGMTTSGGYMISNDPWHDFHRASQFLNEFI